MLLSRRHQMQIPAAWLLAVAVAVLGADRLAGAPAVLEVVGVLGNTSGLSHRPVPYAFYTGIGLDARERIYLAGAVEGVPLCNSDGQCLNVLTLPEAEGLASRSLITRAGDFLFLAAMDGQRSQLYRIDTRSDDPAAVHHRTSSWRPRPLGPFDHSRRKRTAGGWPVGYRKTPLSTGRVRARL